MALSTGKDLHIDKLLTNLAINYPAQNMIADMIAPVVPVQKQSDAYTVFSRFENFAVEDAERAPKTEAKKIQRSVGSASYQCKNYALGYDVPIEDSANMDDGLRLELDTGAAVYLRNKLMLAKEKRVITLAANSSNVSSVFVVNSAWNISGANAGDPFAAIEQAKEYMRALTGQKPNSILFGYSAWTAFRRNYNTRNLIKGVNNGGGYVSRENAQGLLEFDRFLVAEALWHTRNEAYGVGNMTATMSLTNPIDSSVILYYAPLQPSREEPSWMYGFDWRGPGLPARFSVFRHPFDSRRHVDGIEVMEYADERITGSDYAVRIVTNAASGAAGLG